MARIVTSPGQAPLLDSTNACMDDTDQAKWTSDGQTNFASDLSDCGTQCLGGASCTSTCIQKKGYTADCADCMGTLTECSKDNCMFKCFPDSTSAGCKTCVDDNCTPDFETCSGLTPPSSVKLMDIFFAPRLTDSTDACTDDDDQAKWTSDGETNFAGDLKTCGQECLGGASCTSTCIAKLGYTDDCAACFGTLTECSKDNCLFQCLADSTSAGCKSCVDDNCTPAFETCSGLTPPSRAKLADTTAACMDDDDQAKWNDDGQTNFAGDLKTCGTQCMGGASCTADCIAKEGYTADCAACFGTLTECSKDNCMFQCMLDSTSASCKTCVDDNCTDDFETCSGLTPPSSAKLTATTTDACMDDDDQAKWNDDGETNFAGDLKTCGTQCLGGASCTADCIEKLGYTADCAACFGTLTGCSKDHCMFQCMMDSTSAACKTCVDDNCTDDFETCSGLTPPSSTLQYMPFDTTDACMGDDDQAKWNDDGQTNFASDLKECATPCLGGASCTADCIEKKGYTADCAACFGTLTGCSKDNCMFQCMMDSTSASCKTCVDDNCTADFETCSGLTPPSSA